MKTVLTAVVMLFAFTGSVYAAININTATQAELEALKSAGITTIKAKAIIAYRTKAGAFKYVDDIEKVDGINSHTVDMEQLRTAITVTGPTVLRK
ncbi:hypothetical protein LBMAG32_05040 [Nitrosomonadaceae bacterium]|jgi:competence protein ComEA|nr:helix-hairpin-helix domain-containing protein [Nitrosospira sp.]MBI0416231.1 helix-hairpin-helix domain-containing protein [Nitrosospira sp.]MDW7664458.1 helix-hairpin-helix domain-containing protein [Nitrosomonadaceae bacterium]GDX60503.1 hypothetical protein LBMAG32_00370 [Nitrosomonadaceae bacterium]GDX60970.1 hypothetical protein LBMAG32_05040 [Nitrosomonadaceae bacterium]